MARMGEDAERGQSRTPSADLSGESGWVTTDVAARAIRVSPRTIRRYIERDELEAKPQGEGVRREWLVSVDSLHALRATRTSGAAVSEADRGIEPADSVADVLREMSASLVSKAEEAAELRVRLQLTEQAQSTTEEARRRAEEELAEERRRREEAERRAEDLERRLRDRQEPPQAAEGAEARPATGGAQESTEPPGRPGFWRRLFGG
jgi:helix-turn-helix protein